MNILIVDDQKTDREIIGKVVSMAGHTPVFASDGNEAMSSLKSQKLSMIFMDVVMPGKDGFATCRAIKNDPAFKDIPIVMVTSKDTDSDKYWATKQGANDHLAKPFTPAAIISLIQRFVG
jgi:CheY-like chemotaxis protein